MWETLNLDSSVERARVCGFQVGRQGAKRRMATSCNDEQHSQTIWKPYNRVRSDFTHLVSKANGVKSTSTGHLK